MTHNYTCEPLAWGTGGPLGPHPLVLVGKHAIRKGSDGEIIGKRVGVCGDGKRDQYVREISVYKGSPAL